MAGGISSSETFVERKMHVGRTVLPVVSHPVTFSYDRERDEYVFATLTLQEARTILRGLLRLKKRGLLTKRKRN